jgi:hypothetical protein
VIEESNVNEYMTLGMNQIHHKQENVRLVLFYFSFVFSTFEGGIWILWSPRNEGLLMLQFERLITYNLINYNQVTSNSI